MNINSFRPAHDFAVQFGVKIVIFGGPGSGKTPLAASVSRACMCMSEPGFLSIRKSTIPTFPAFNSIAFDEFITWGTTSHEASAFDTYIIDSISQVAEKKVEEELGGSSKQGNEVHGQRAYGRMSRWMMENLNKLYFLQSKNVILIAKQQNFEQNDTIYRRPYFPGRELPVRVPHLFDEILHLGLFNVPGITPSPVRAFRCRESFDGMARDRSGNLQEYEPADLNEIIKKCKL